MITKEQKKEWFDKNAGKATFLRQSIIPLDPNCGYYITVNGIDIPSEIFPEEYKVITSKYFDVIKKMTDHYYKK